MQAHELEPEVIRKEARKVAMREVDRQREEFKQFAVMTDWSNETTYRTIGARTPCVFFDCR